MEPSFAAEGAASEHGSCRGPAQALRAPDRRRRAAHARGRARARPAQGRRRRRGEAAADRVEPAARDVDHAQLHEGQRPAARPDPGGEPRPDPRGREVRLPARLQALDLRDLVDPPGDHARARRPGPDDPASRARGRAGSAPAARPPPAGAEAQPRAVARGARARDAAVRGARPRAARARRGPRQPRDARRRRREHLRRPDRGRQRARAARADAPSRRGGESWPGRSTS